MIKEDAHYDKGGKIHRAFKSVLDFMDTVQIPRDEEYLQKLVSGFENDLLMVSSLKDPTAVEEILENGLRITFDEAIGELESNDWSEDRQLMDVLSSSDPSDDESLARIAKEFLLRLMKYMDGSVRLGYPSKRAISLITPMLEEYTSGRINRSV